MSFASVNVAADRAERGFKEIKIAAGVSLLYHP
jgi:hypothetical protein